MSKVVGMTENNAQENTPSAAIPDDISEAPEQGQAGTATQPSPAQDLYRHVNGAWLSTHKIPSDRPVDGTFHQLRDRAEQEVRQIVETAASNEPNGRVGALYSSFMDVQGIAAAGLNGLRKPLGLISDATSVRDLAEVLGRLDVEGTGGVVGYWIEKDSSQDIERAYLVQTGLGLPDEAYYREEQHAATREAYREFVEDMLQLVSELELPGRYATPVLPQQPMPSVPSKPSSHADTGIT